VWPGKHNIASGFPCYNGLLHVQSVSQNVPIKVAEACCRKRQDCGESGDF
jgi:hypothetical protein